MLKSGWLGALALATLTQLVPAAPATAQAWPQRPVSFIVPFPAGGGTDAFARPLAAQLEQQLGQRILIDNRGGAGGTLGGMIVARARPDGCTLLVANTAQTFAPVVYAEQAEAQEGAANG